jgi:hypothetical protein
MTDPINLALRREIKRAVAETLQQSEARHPCLPIKKAPASPWPGRMFQNSIVPL